MSNLKWKERLLSSSFPFEFDAAKILMKKGFGISYDYTYKRYDDKDEKDFSIDIHADSFYPFKWQSPIQQTVDLLIECKFRNPNVKWVFLPDINYDHYHQFSSRGTLKFVDEFSHISADGNFGFLVEHEKSMKGMEINLQSGEVHDEGIRHGCYQLLYGSSTLLYNNIFSALYDSIEETYPFTICPILVTTAEIYLAQPDFGIKSVLKSDSIEKFSYKVDCLRYKLTIPPSFQHHCINVFKKLFSYENPKNNYEYFCRLRQNSPKQLNKHKYQRDPRNLMTSLINGLEKDFFEEIIICSSSYFPTLIDKIKRGIKIIDKTKKILK